MRNFCIGGFAAATLALCTQAYADVPRSVIEQARSQTFSGRTAGIIYAVQHTGSSWEVISVFSQLFEDVLFRSDARKRWVLRRQAGQGDSMPSGGLWADSDTCPQIEGVLWSLERLVVPSFEVPGISARRPSQGVSSVPLPVDGPQFSIWGQGIQPSGAPAFLSMSGLGGELDRWGVHAEAELEGCWRDQPTSG